MTLQQAVDTLNANKFWDYDTWAIGTEPWNDRPAGSYVLPVPGGYPMSPEVVIHLATVHPHDNGREYA